jgi:hypothetical protein
MTDCESDTYKRITKIKNESQKKKLYLHVHISSEFSLPTLIRLGNNTIQTVSAYFQVVTISVTAEH